MSKSLAAIQMAMNLVLVLSASIASAAEPECGSEELSDGRSATYCIQQSAGGANSGKVIYYLHGLGGDTQEAFDQGLTAEVASATVITVSFGPAWFFAPEDADAPGSATMEAFVGELMPRLEDRLDLPSLESGNRALVGASMGGLNATQLFEQHAELFGRVALLCPALSVVSPYASPAEIYDYIRRTDADPAEVARALVLGRAAYPNEEIWAASTPFNPDNLSRVGPQSPPLFVSIGREDEWGFFEGTEAFVEKVQEQGVASVEWIPVDGPHCSFDRQALRGFLVPR